jgi:hypothetical protein
LSAPGCAAEVNWGQIPINCLLVRRNGLTVIPAESGAHCTRRFDFDKNMALALVGIAYAALLFDILT